MIERQASGEAWRRCKRLCCFYRYGADVEERSRRGEGRRHFSRKRSLSYSLDLYLLHFSASLLVVLRFQLPLQDNS